MECRQTGLIGGGFPWFVIEAGEKPKESCYINEITLLWIGL